MAEKFAGSHDKFRIFLKNHFEQQQHAGHYTQNTPDIIEAIKKSDELSFAHEEKNYIINNITNYLTLAMNQGIISGLGRKKGYELRNEIDPQSGLIQTFAEHKPPSEPSKPKTATKTENAPREAFCHFPASFILSKYFNGRAVSLKKTEAQGGFHSNPDICIIKNKFDGIPEHILSPIRSKFYSESQYEIISIELKYNWEKSDQKSSNRDQISKLSEAVSNSSWAHEAWLVNFSNFSRPDDEIYESSIKFSKRCNLGLLNIKLSKENGDAFFSVEILNRPDTREYLDIASDERHIINNVLTKLADEINNNGGDYYANMNSWKQKEIENDNARLALAWIDAEKNLSSQFSERKEIGSIIDTIKHEDNDLAQNICRAIVTSACEIISIDTPTSIQFDPLSKEINHLIVGSQTEYWKNFLNYFKTAFEPNSTKDEPMKLEPKRRHSKPRGTTL